MTDFTTIIQKFDEQGEKTGWTYVDIPAAIADKIKPGVRTSYRVKGWLDALAVDGLALTPMGNGDFILTLKADLRRKLGKQKGAPLRVRLEEDNDFKFEVPDDLSDLMNDDPDAHAYFDSLSNSHRNYFLKWYWDAKTEPTRLKRLEQIYDALQKRWDYGLMIRKGKPRAE